MSETTTNVTVIPIHTFGAIMEVTETGRAWGRLAVRVLVHGMEGHVTPMPMLVRLPARCATPTVGALVVFEGLRGELRAVNGRMRTIARADRVRKVACDAAA